jgi:integrase
VARAVNRLNARLVSSLAKPGLHADGHSLYLRVDERGAKRWVFIYKWRGKRTEMGLGPLWRRSLAEARQIALGLRIQLYDGVNPLHTRRAEKEAPTFEAQARSLVEDLASGWKHPRAKERWLNSFTQHAASLWGLPVDQIQTADVLAVLKPIWSSKAETAGKLRGRIERVLDAAAAKGLRSADNPARWEGHLAHLLPARTRLSRGHHKALPYSDAPALVASLRGREAPAARALAFVIHTAARENEVLGATWAEIDLARRVWTVPASRTKAGREHQVPLSDPAFTVLGEPGRPDELIFPSSKGRKMSDMAMDMLLRRMKVDVNVHGFRSTFRDWAGDETEFPREIAEAALGHKVGDAVEQAYRRGTALERRRKLMDAWSGYLVAPRQGG